MQTSRFLLSALSVLFFPVPCAFGGDRPMAKGEESSVEEIGPIPEISPGQTTIVLPKAPAGFKVSLAGSDRKPVIGVDGRIHPPLNPQTVRLVLEVSMPGGEVEMVEREVKVPGQHADRGVHPEPPIIPSLREWHGGEGVTNFHAGTRIVMEEGSDPCRKMAGAIAGDWAAVTGHLPEITGGEARPGDLVLVLDPATSPYGPEGYRIDAGDFLVLTAPETTGWLWGSRSLLQVLSQHEGRGAFPRGTAVDYPKYERRGVTLDVSRKFYTIGYLRRLVRDLAWFKLNVLHLHLTDDQGFRLESETYPGLAAADGHYTKREFRDLIELGRACGVTVVPEINSPGHVGAILRYRPELGTHGAFDLDNPEGMTFMKNLWAEYLDPRDPTFTGPWVHLGSDEVETSGPKQKELMREWLNEMSSFVRSFGKETRVWGGLDRYAGETPVDRHLQMDLWNWGWGNAATALPGGHRLSNVDDSKLYIVPYSGIYRDYLDRADLYQNWEPNQFPALTIPAGHPQMLGANFAIWNDRSPSYGISMDDTTDRLLAAATVFSEKSWQGSREDADFSAFVARCRAVGEDPVSNLRYPVSTSAKGGILIEYRFDGDLTDASGNGRTAIARHTEFAEGEAGLALRLKGGESYAGTPVSAKGFGYSVSFSIKPDAGNPADAVILESPEGTLTLNTKGSGKLGFSKEGDTTVFDYVLPESKWTNLTITGDASGVCLYVNGDEHVERTAHRERLATFVLPLARIGSERHSFAGLIDHFKVLDHVVDLLGANRNLALDRPVKASSWELGRHELAPEKAVDGDLATRWSTAPQAGEWLWIDLGRERTLDRAVIHWEIQRGAHYRLLVSTDGESWTNVLPDDGAFIVERRFDPLNFPPVRARFVKFQGVKLSNWGYAIFEMELYGPGGKLDPAYREEIAAARTLLENKRGSAEEQRQAAEKIAEFPLGNGRMAGPAEP